MRSGGALSRGHEPEVADMTLPPVPAEEGPAPDVRASSNVGNRSGQLSHLSRVEKNAPISGVPFGVWGWAVPVPLSPLGDVPATPQA